MNIMIERPILTNDERENTWRIQTFLWLYFVQATIITILSHYNPYKSPHIKYQQTI